MFKLKLYKYDSTQESNGYRGIDESDFSDYIAQGEDISEDITQVMDTAEITLHGIPVKEAFLPETKFILDVVEYNNRQQETIVQTIHFVVSRDTVNQPILSNNNYFDHHISFIEPSVIAQKRIVDNISTTYKLKDVNLQERVAYPDTRISFNMQTSAFTPEVDFIRSDSIGFATSSYNICVGKYFEPEGSVIFKNANGETITNIYADIERFKIADGRYFANITLPKIKIMYGDFGAKTFSNIGYASISYKIEEFDLTDTYNPTRTWSGNIISNSQLPLYGKIDAGIPTWWNSLDHEWLYEKAVGTSPNAYGQYYPIFYYKKYTETSVETPSYTISNVELKVDKEYKITISLYQFPDNIPTNSEVKGNIQSGYNYALYKKLTDSQPCYFSRLKASYLTNGGSGKQDFDYFKNLLLVEGQTSGISRLVTYNVATGRLVYASSTPYSALALLQKAVINSGLYEKEDGVYIADINNSNLPFYVDPTFEDELKATLIIENFYNQKNLWEIMVEVGNYIHAIPELKFGSNDRFMITFNRLGITEDDMEANLGGKVGYKNKQNGATKLSIYNSRSVEDYISATSSYITNMVQLGGYIEEWVAPKTSDGQLLVSNDTGEIIVSKPIIELLDIKVRRNSDGIIKDLTNYIYEENVYKTLSIDYQVTPNRGNALFYKLGTNVIAGGNYQLPQANTNIYTDYAIKKVIYSAFNGYPSIAPAPNLGYWTTLKLNDYSFFVRYRTKDSVRQNHVRPDIRKYLLNTKWDKYPEHNQFNNQTDVVVDSIKFGNNMLGKLIKTGNNSYDIYEWNDRWANVKHKGELYRLNGELYYVAKITHTIYHAHIISCISYSKDYNELSNIIGIPSEPRFSEISEQSLIWREFEINDVLLLTDKEEQIEYKSNYIFNYNHLSNLIIGEGTDFAKYAVTVFKGDKDAEQYDQTVGQKDLYIEVINPINAYSSENTLTYEYDMEDNYSAGNKVITTDKNEEVKGSYNSLWAVKYTDIYGKAPLMDFYILGNIGKPNTSSPSGFTPPTPNETMAFPESPISTKKDDSRQFIGDCDILATNVMQYDTNFNGRGLGLLKDCREAMSINYNLRMVTSSDTFVLSPYVYLPKKSNVRLVLLSEEVNKLSTGYIDNSKVITPIDKQGNAMNPYFTFTIDKITGPNSWDTSKSVITKFGVDLVSAFENVADEHFIDTEGYQRVKGIAILCDVSLDAGIETENPVLPYKTQFIVARNIPEDFTREQALKNWIWGSPKKDKLFTKKQ